MSRKRQLLHLWSKWGALVAFVVSLVAVHQTSQSLNEARDANALTRESLTRSERPWFAVTALRVESLDASSYRFVAAIKHYSGGPALEVSYAIGINKHSSEFYGAASALLPSDSLRVVSQTVIGPKLQHEDTVRWQFRFSDATGRRYTLHQTFQLQPIGLKQLAYLPGQVK